MPPRRTTNFGELFEALVEDLRVRVAASVEQRLGEFDKRLSRLEKRVDQLSPETSQPAVAAQRKTCTLCERPGVARGLCSAHYQQWRYRERKSRYRPQAQMREAEGPKGSVSTTQTPMTSTLILPQSRDDILNNN